MKAATGRTKAKRPWFVYMLRASDKSLYTGITTDIDRRVEEHRSGRGKGAKALRGKKRLKLVFRKRVGSVSAALRMEYAIKRMSKPAKERLVASAR